APRLDAAGEPLAQRGVARPQRRAETVRGVIRDAHGLVRVAYAHHRGGGAERFFPEGRHVGRDAGEHRRPEEVALPAHALAAGEGARPGAHGRIDLALQRVEEVAPGERTDLRLRIHRVADDQILHALRETSLEVVADGLDDDEALGGDARLAVVLIARADAGGRSGLKVRVREDDERIRSTELEHGLLEGTARELRDA